jgi:hypothetical protein
MFGFVPPPQHDWSSMHARPVMVHPDEGVHAVAPVPRSAQMRVQQVELPEQGMPFCVQPPGGTTQYPALPLLLLQSFVQQSRSS